jgi:isopenicillin N synthase-like dioxygenase
MRYAGAADSLVATGYARVQLGPAELTTLGALRTAAADFFARDEQWKRGHGDEPGLFGFRPYGMQFSDDPDLRDECESFSYWADRPELVPGRQDVGEFIAALSSYWQIATELTAGILTQLAAHYGYHPVLDTGPASYVEINSYGRPPDREFLQTRHEDGHLITLVIPNKRGLEVEIDGEMRAERAGQGEVLIMPGSLLTSMTGGEIPPLYHRVRNFRDTGRLTVLYFVNTPFHGHVSPYVLNDTNAGIDMAQLAREKCTLFGKPLPHVLT